MFAATFAHAVHQHLQLATAPTLETTVERTLAVEPRQPEHRLFAVERAVEVVAFARVGFAAQA